MPLSSASGDVSDSYFGRGTKRAWAEEQDPLLARRALLAWLRERLEADAAIYQRFVKSPEGTRHASVDVDGPKALQRLRAWEGELTRDLPPALRPDQTSPVLRNRMRAWLAHDQREVGESRLFRKVLAPAGFSDQARAVAFREGRHLGYVSAVFLEDRRVERKRLGILAEIEPAVLDALEGVAAVHTRVCMPERLLLSAGGELELHDRGLPAGPCGERFRAWLAARARELEARSATFYFEGFRFGFTRMEGQRAPAWCVDVDRLHAAELDEVEELTARQQSVAELAAEGFTNVEIGARLGLSPNTVKSHVKRVYETLGVSNRAELARRLRTRAPSL